MNGYSRLDFAARRQGWETTPLEVRTMMLWSRLFSKGDLIIEVYFSGHIINTAVLYDGADNTEDRLTQRDNHKAERIEDVLLGNSRKF